MIAVRRTQANTASIVQPRPDVLDAKRDNLPSGRRDLPQLKCDPLWLGLISPIPLLIESLFRRAKGPVKAIVRGSMTPRSNLGRACRPQLNSASVPGSLCDKSGIARRPEPRCDDSKSVVRSLALPAVARLPEGKVVPEWEVRVSAF
jgi:hypothetical protein